MTIRRSHSVMRASGESGEAPAMTKGISNTEFRMMKWIPAFAGMTRGGRGGMFCLGFGFGL